MSLLACTAAVTDDFCEVLAVAFEPVIVPAGFEDKGCCTAVFAGFAATCFDGFAAAFAGLSTICFDGLAAAFADFAATCFDGFAAAFAGFAATCFDGFAAVFVAEDAFAMKILLEALEDYERSTI